MINLLYVILMAMLAINVSGDVMKGYIVMFRSLDKSTGHSLEENRQVLSEIKQLYGNNPVKTRTFMDMAVKVRAMADSICTMADSARRDMAVVADGKYDLKEGFVNAENMDVSCDVMVKGGRAKEIARCLGNFRSMVLSVMPEGRKKAKVADCLLLEEGKWWDSLFSDIPLTGAVTLLAKIQNDVRYAEGEALHALLENIDTKDMRANRLEAFVVPEARRIVEGDRFKARIMLAAVDTTQMPEVFIDSRGGKLSGDVIEIAGGSEGQHVLSGKIVVADRFGDKKVLPFKEEYSVMAPMSSVTSSLMNILYAGYENSVEVSASGVAPSDISIWAAGCEVTRKGSARYSIKPASSLIGKDAEIRVAGKTASGKDLQFVHKFHVRSLPEPLPFIVSATGKFSGGRMTKGTVLSAQRIGAAADDGVLDILYKVLSFEMVFFDNIGNAKVYQSQGDRLSEEQKRMVQSVRKNSRCYITSIKVKGPDGVVKTLKSSMEIVFRNI